MSLATVNTAMRKKQLPIPMSSFERAHRSEEHR